MPSSTLASLAGSQPRLSRKVIVRLTGYVSLGSIVSALILPVAAWLLHPSARPLIWIQVLVAVAIVWLHRANIRRLLAGTENRFGRRGRQEPAA